MAAQGGGRFDRLNSLHSLQYCGWEDRASIADLLARRTLPYLSLVALVWELTYQELSLLCVLQHQLPRQ
jgi:hypothetical protein